MMMVSVCVVVGSGVAGGLGGGSGDVVMGGLAMVVEVVLVGWIVEEGVLVRWWW